MDEILSQFKTTVLTPETEDGSRFEDLYKNWGKLGQQEQRRKDSLDSQKRNRNSKLDTCRGVLDLVNEIEQQDISNCKTQPTYRPSIYVAGFNKISRSYRNVLMMSEWMVERPEDFNDNWYVVPCPKGVRTLVVASRGITKFYTKYGQYRMSCATALPGGHPSDFYSNSHCIVLDCFHVQTTNTLYVLDLLVWNSQPMSDGETEFRHFWMKTHIEDIPEVKTINSKNKIIFEILPKVDCTRDSFNKFMMTWPHFKNQTPALDGLLFYHKMAHYISGVTPLVGWLYPFMVNEVLGIDITVNPGYLVDRPIGYVNQARFIQEFESKDPKKLPKFAKSAVSMDTSSEGDEISNQKKGRTHKHKTESDITDGAQMNVWQPTATTFKLLSQQTDTIKPRLTKIRPFTEETG